MGAYGNVALGRGGILKRNILGQSVSFEREEDEVRKPELCRYQ